MLTFHFTAAFPDYPSHSRGHNSRAQNYFYPDTPKNYQITQYDKPIAEHGLMTLPSGKKVREPTQHD